MLWQKIEIGGVVSSKTNNEIAKIVGEKAMMLTPFCNEIKDQWIEVRYPSSKNVDPRLFDLAKVYDIVVKIIAHEDGKESIMYSSGARTEEWKSQDGHPVLSREEIAEHLNSGTLIECLKAMAIVDGPLPGYNVCNSAREYIAAKQNMMNNLEKVLQ